MGRPTRRISTFSHFSDNGSKSLRGCSVVNTDAITSSTVSENLSEIATRLREQKLVTIGNYVKLGNFYGFFLGQDGLPVIE